MRAVIEVQDIARRFGSVRAVDGVSFEVRAGEVVGLLGPNGAGKTTALRVLAGLLTPDHGQARLGGISVLDDPRAARRTLGFLTGSTGLYERLTGREVLAIFGQLQGLEGEALEGRIAAVVAELELEAFVDRRCGAMSSGQRQRVSIARAVVHDPSALVLDEPTAALDPVAARDILELVRRARDRSKAVLFSTHRMEEADSLCSRLLFMREGRIVAQGAPGELLAQSGQRSLTAAFLHFAQRGAA
jgi:sodium transport system ATP-binding protein